MRCAILKVFNGLKHTDVTYVKDDIFQGCRSKEFTTLPYLEDTAPYWAEATFSGSVLIPPRHPY